MSCNCTQAGLIPKCTTTLTLGTITSFTTAVYVIIKNIATGRTQIQSFTTDGAGSVDLDMTDPAKQFFGGNQQYEVHVSLQSADNINDKETLTINTVADTCFFIEFENVRDTAGNLNEIAAQTL